ncbi:MAG: sulfite exporter TauE/SafE family protein [Myxococcales bacterium]|nr:sulfite exporter TauE/SafE family protein [Myxococcales bacterium]
MKLALPLALPLVGLAGVAASIVNSMAGGGGFIVLPTLLGLGVGPGVANGTFRVGLVLQNLSGMITFWRRDMLDGRMAARLSPAIALGAVGGAYAATHIPGRLLKPIFGWVFIAWAIVLVVFPKSFEAPAGGPRKPTWWHDLLGAAVGGYGGFLQAGVGLPLVAFLVGAVGMPPVRGNAVKMTLVLVYTLLALPLFIAARQVHWPAGGALAVGMLLGAYIGVRLQVREGGARLVRWVVFFAVLGSGVVMALL